MPTLLGHLVNFASFWTQGELLCTQGLAHLLREHEPAQKAFERDVSSRAGVSLPTDLRWSAEERQDDGGRPDLEACAGERPVIKIEAKIGAAISEGQVRSYLSDLHVRGAGGVFLIVVPEWRVADMQAWLSETLHLSGPPSWRPADYSGVTLDVLSWEEVIKVLKIGVGTDPCLYDVRQLEEMYRQLSRNNVRPFASEEEIREWRERESCYFALFDGLTRRLGVTYQNGTPRTSSEVLERDPTGTESRLFQQRYFGIRLGDKTPCFSIGVRDPFEGTSTPLWLRFHHETPCFALIHDRLRAASLRSPFIVSGRQVWIALEVPKDAHHDEMLDGLCKQVEEIVEVAYKPL